MKIYNFCITALLLCLSLFSCVNEEGEGGSATIEGYVYKIMHPDGEYIFKTDTFPAGSTEVSITYGKGQIKQDDNIDAAPDGYFRFKYLFDGNYIVYAYSEYPNGKREAVCDTVHVKNGKTAKTDTIYIHDGKMYGKSYIKGKVLANYYDNNRLVAENAPAAEQRVYIQKQGIGFPFNDVRAGSDGTFIFEKLPVGKYQVYAASEDSDRIIYVEKLYDVEITEESSMVEMEEPIIIKLRS